MSKTIPVKIWDVPTRLFHWTLAVGMGFMWFSAEMGGFWMDWHMQVGIFMLALVLFRIVWGLIGSETSRFTSFLSSPKAALQHLHELKQPKEAYHAGHNPLGAWMVVFLLAGLLVQGGTGLFASDDIMVEAPLYGLVSESLSSKLTGIHHLVFNLLLLAAAVHIFAVIFYKLRKRTNLIKAMVAGSADWPAHEPAPTALKFASPWLALVVVVVCYALVLLGLEWLQTLP